MRGPQSTYATLLRHPSSKHIPLLLAADEAEALYRGASGPHQAAWLRYGHALHALLKEART